MKRTLFLILLALILEPRVTKACTSFQVKAKDNSVIIARTMEFPVDTKSVIWVIPRGENYTSISDKGIKGLSWKNKYAFIAVDGFNLSTSYVEGMNEKGLSVGALMYNGAKYQDQTTDKFVTYADLIGWLLGNFSTVKEAKSELPKIKVIDKNIKEVSGSLGLHFAIHDASGQAIVVEFIDGEQKIYDNKVGVMTNRPDFNWQLTNLRNYINLASSDKEPRKVNGLTIEPTGVGSGMLGIPGDWTPPSRFVRIAYSVDAALTPKNSLDAVNLAEHLMNIVDIPKGVIKEKVKYVFTTYGNTQWSVIKDLSNNVMYFRTYDNMTLRKIDLNSFNIEHGALKRSVAISKDIPSTIDVSHTLR